MYKVARETTELSLNLIFDTIKNNATELFPDSKTVKHVMERPGYSQIVISLPIGYIESNITLYTDFLDCNYSSGIIEIRLAEPIPGTVSFVGPEKYQKLLKALTNTLSEPTTTSYPDRKSIFNDL